MVSLDFFAFVFWFGLSIYHGPRYVGGGGVVSKAKLLSHKLGISSYGNIFVGHYRWIV